VSPDRQAIENSLEDWVISDKESLVAWVSRFLWCWEDGGLLHRDAAKIIVDQISQAQLCLQGPEQMEQILIVSPESFFHKQEDQ
jgi:hypothetical protein